MSASRGKIHVTNSTGLSLNERFTAVQDSRRDIPEPRVFRTAARATSVHNRSLLQLLARRHKLQAALKLKRRSIRPVGGSVAMRRGTIKDLLAAANRKPIRNNSLNTIRMETDLISNEEYKLNRSRRRANSVSNRSGSRRPLVGGAAQRIAQRRLQCTLTGNGMMNEMQRRGRSRHRPRASVDIINLTRSRSLSTGRGVPALPQKCGHSRSPQRQGSRVHAIARANLSIKARLGMHPGAIAHRRCSLSGIRGVAQGRIQRRSNTNLAGRTRGRSMARITNANGRSRERTRYGAQTWTQSRTRSRTRGGTVNGRRDTGSAQGGVIRGRSQQRSQGGGAGRGAPTRRNGEGNGTKNRQQKQQQQRRGRRRRKGGHGGRNQVKNAKLEVNKEKLDKELDHYMGTTRIENNDLLSKI